MRKFQRPYSVPSSIPSRYLPALALLMLAVVVLLPSTPALYPSPNTDNAVFLFVGERILAGDLPYRDWYDHKPPMIHYLNALGLWLGNGSRWGVWAVELVSLAAASLLAFTFLRRYFGALAAWLSVAAFLLHLVLVLERGNLTEEYALPFQFGAILLLSHAEQAKRKGLIFFLMGAILAAASSLKQPLAGIGLAVGVYLLLAYGSQNRWRSLAGAYTAILSGVLTVWAAWFIYFAAAGILPEFWEGAFGYNFALSGIPTAARIQSLITTFEILLGLGGLFLGGMLAWLVVIPYLLVKDHRLIALVANRHLDWERTAPLFLPLVIALVDLPVALALTALSGSNFLHYYMALLPALTVLMAFLIHSVLELFGEQSARSLRWAWLVALLWIVFSPGIVAVKESFKPYNYRHIDVTVRYIQENTNAEDYIYQWGVNPQLYLLSGRVPSSRYLLANYLFADGFTGQAQTEELLRDFQARSPTLIIYQGILTQPLLMPVGGQTCETVKSPEAYAAYVQYWQPRLLSPLPVMPEGLPEIYYWICENYKYVATVSDSQWQIYQLKGK